MFIIAQSTTAKKMEILHMFINECADESLVVYINNKILFGHKKKWSMNSCYNVDEPPKHYVKWKKPGTKCGILHNFIHMKYLGQKNLQIQKEDSWLRGSGGRE